jgi:carbon-monoxide dehydrogenase large subunit
VRLIGGAVTRVEDARVLTGRGRYADDVRLPGMLHAAFVRSPYPHARIVAIDATEARQLDGVHLVLTGDDIRRLTGPLTTSMSPPGLVFPEFYALAVGKVRVVGDPVALVVADSRYVAEDACDLVDVEYEPYEPVADAPGALAPTAPLLFDDVPGNVIFRTESTFGDVDAAFAAADRVITETFMQHRHANVPIETHGLVAAYDPGTGELVCHASTQSLHMYRQNMSSVTGHPLERLRVVCGDIGGAFGLKGFVPREEVAVVAAALEVGRPVKWIEDRNEHLLIGGQAREESVRLEAAVAADGTLLALRADLLMDQGAYPGFPFCSSVFLIGMRMRMPGPYHIQAYAFRGTVAATNKGTYVAYRGPWEIETWVRERMLDVIARELGVDPAEVRRRNMVCGAPGDRLVTGPRLDGVSSRLSFDIALDAIGYEARRAEQVLARAEGRLVGIGFGTYIDMAPGPPEAWHKGEMFESEPARARLEPDGHLSVFTPQSSSGQGHETTLAQVAADELGVPFDHVRIVKGDTELTPFGLFGTASSRSATWATGAVLNSTRLVKDKVLAIAAELLEVAVDDLEIREAQVVPRGVPDRAVSLASIARAAALAPDQLPPGFDTSLEARFQFRGEGVTGTGWSGGTHACVVEVDRGTGGVRILRYVVAEDCGRIINPGIVDGQIRGAIAQGIGAVLYERSVYDGEAQNLATSFMDYLVPTATEIPCIEIHHLDTRLEGEVDFRGIGEGGAQVAPVAVSNAIEDALAALGARVTEQHLTPARILELAGIIH